MSGPVPRARRTCPICGKAAIPDHDPFCSERCKTIDLGNWLGGRYAIPTAEPADPADREGGDGPGNPVDTPTRDDD